MFGCVDVEVKMRKNEEAKLNYVFSITAAYFDDVSKLVCCNEVSAMAKNLNKLFYASAKIRFCCLITGLLIN